MKKILTIVSLFTALNLVAHSHEEMHLSNSSFYHSDKAIVSNLELGKTEDGDMAFKLKEFGVSSEVEKQGDIYYTKDLLVRLHKGDNKLSSEIIVPVFELAPYNEKFKKDWKKGVNFHSFAGALHVHIDIEKEEKAIEINHVDYDVNIEVDGNRTIYTEKDGKFVFTTWEDKRNSILPMFGLLIAANNFEMTDGMMMGEMEKEHKHEHNHMKEDGMSKTHKHEHEHEKGHDHDHK